MIRGKFRTPLNINDGAKSQEGISNETKILFSELAEKTPSIFILDKMNDGSNEKQCLRA